MRRKPRLGAAAGVNTIVLPLCPAGGDLVLLGRTPTLRRTRWESHCQDPLAVTVTFTQAPGKFRVNRRTDEDVAWVFARSLLTQGLLGAVGEGAVLVAPDPPSPVALTLRSGGASTFIHFNQAALSLFLADTDRICRPGRELVHNDREFELALANLLA